MKNIVVRPARKEDLPVLLEFEQGIVEAERPMDSTLKDGRLSYYDIAAMIDADDVEVLVAEQNGELIGSGYARIMEAKPYLRHDRFTYLGFMFVPKEHRGKGVNRLIVDGLNNWTRSQGIFETRLDVYHNNPAAIRAYEKAGFSKNMVEMRLGL